MSDFIYDEQQKRIIDSEFKTAIHKPTVLATLLHYSIEEFKDCSIEEIKRCLGVKPRSTFVKGRETEYFSERYGKVQMDNVFDVRLPGSDDKVSVIINVEGQNDDGNNKYISKRAEYYISRLVCRQKGSEFFGTEYEKIRRVYSILR